MQVNFDFKIKDPITEKDVEDTAAKLLAGILLQRPEGVDIIKAYDWANKLINDGVLDLDRADAQLMEDVVRKNQNIYVLASAPIVLAIKAARDEEDKPKENKPE